MPIGALCRRGDGLEPSASIARAARWFQEEEQPALPVVRDGILVGAVLEQDLLASFHGESGPDSPIEPLVRQSPPTIHPAEYGAAALRRFTDSQSSYLIVADERGFVHGLMTPARLVALPDPSIRPRALGGMATPAGVYLTNGVIGAGVGPLALLATGALLFGIFLVAGTIVVALRNVLILQGVIAPAWAAGPWGQAAANVLALALFFGGMRSLPLAGIHAAEHMVVHAIERGEDLAVATVSRMPRVHPRCGTNFAVAAMLFLGLFSLPWVADAELRMLVAFLATLALFRPLGSAVQHFITTKPPTKAQIEMGIRSGRALLSLIQTAPGGPPTPWQRIASSGILFIIIGSFFAQLVVWLVLEVFRVPAAWRPF